jgi:hypothetical protein
MNQNDLRCPDCPHTIHLGVCQVPTPYRGTQNGGVETWWCGCARGVILPAPASRRSRLSLPARRRRIAAAALGRDLVCLFFGAIIGWSLRALLP